MLVTVSDSKSRKAIGLRLKSIRKRLGFTQSSIAKALGGCTQTFISQIEHGDSGPSAAVVAGVQRLGFSGDWLMTGEGEMLLATEEPAVLVRDRPVEWRQLPVLGRVPADYPGPSPVEEHAEGHFPVMWSMVPDRDAFVLRVQSDSMSPEVDKGDLIVVSPALKDRAKNGDLVVARIDGDDVYLKRILHSNGRLLLMSANPRYAPVIVDDDRCVTVLGKVVLTIRHHR